MAWTLFETPIGECGVAWSDAGVTWLQLPERTREATRARLVEKANEEGREARTLPAWVKDAIARVREHLSGRPQELGRVPLDLGRVTPFTAKILRAAQRVPAGATASYGDLAKAVGSPGAARAVGRAMATNPFPLLVPCHRVVGASARSAGGFSAYGGLVTKERLLAVEGATLATLAKTGAQQSLFRAKGGAPRLPFDASAAVDHLAKADPVLGRHIARVGPLGLTLKETEGTFAALAEAIVYQQLSGKAAATIFGRVRALYPGGRLEPSAVLATRDDALRGAGLSANKLASLRDLAERAARGEIPTLAQLARMDDDAIVETLTRVRGVGRWTVEMLLIFRLGRPDVLPLADYGIKKGFARVFPKLRTKYGPEGLPMTSLLESRGARWAPYRSVASWYLWRATDALPPSN
jgi:methylated-DNA-[protein]-cysteine S-methyltransferase